MMNVQVFVAAVICFIAYLTEFSVDFNVDLLICPNLSSSTTESKSEIKVMAP